MIIIYNTMSNSNSTKTHGCTPCGYLCSSKSNLAKQYSSKKHEDKIENPDAVIVGGFQCKNCDKVYKSNPGLWAHNKKCKPAVVAVEVPEPDLREEINNLKVMIIELAKNQQPTTINNDNRVNNSINNNNFINIFLNDKCHNACDIKKYIAGIDFSKENYQNLLKDYVGRNAEIITKSYNSLPEYERPIYSFIGEDEHQKVVHIQHDDKWVVERELGWTNQVRIECNENMIYTRE
jgi:hypothetical protein